MDDIEIPDTYFPEKAKAGGRTKSGGRTKTGSGKGAGGRTTSGARTKAGSGKGAGGGPTSGARTKAGGGTRAGGGIGVGGGKVAGGGTSGARTKAGGRKGAGGGNGVGGGNGAGGGEGAGVGTGEGNDEAAHGDGNNGSTLSFGEFSDEDEYGSYEIFNPKLYDFELNNYNKLKTKLFENTLPNNLEISCPEFAIILDHSIALLWLFYNDNQNWHKFTVPHIEWALKFISGITSGNGQTFIDMETIKNQLEQLLFQAYSEIDRKAIDETPPIDDFGVFGPINCPDRTQPCTPIPETLKELLSRAPDMVMHLSLSTGAESDSVSQKDLENSHLSRITEDLELFELIKSLKEELGYSNGTVNPNEITSLRVKLEELEKKLLDQSS